MNRRRIRWIIALMSVALIGIIMLQVYWISNDLRLKEKQFDQTVSQAMNAITDKIETREAFSIMNKRLADFDTKHITNVLIKDSNLVPPVSITDTQILIPDN